MSKCSPRPGPLSRRSLLVRSLASMLLAPAFRPAWPAGHASLERRNIPSTGEALPVVGCGTYQTFDVSDSLAEREPLFGVLSTLFAAGGSVIDTSPMYGRSEGVIGELLQTRQNRNAAFLATKVWTRGATSGREQLRHSLDLLRTDRIDLVQVHNLLDWQTHLPLLRSLKAEGRIRYVGVTHYLESAYPELEAVLKSQALDFVQVNYSVDEAAAGRRILPLARDRGVAVLINRPFGGGGILRRLKSEPLPAWAQDIGCQSWPQVLLRYVLSHPAVTCVIPGTGRPDYMQDNVGAGVGPQPNTAQQERIAETVRSR